MQKSLRGLEHFFWIYLLLNPILDIVNGLYIWMLTRGYAGMDALNYRELTNAGGLTTTPALVVRMVVLLIMVAYILMLRDKRAILTALPMGVAVGNVGFVGVPLDRRGQSLVRCYIFCSLCV